MMRVQRDPAQCARLHLHLLEAPAESFRAYFGGCAPSEEEKLAYIEGEVRAMANASVYANDVYEVEMRAIPPFVCLTICRLDGGPCDEWSDLQQIKNELVGPENEAVRPFPPERQPHDPPGACLLWVHMDPAFRFTAGSVARSFLVRGDTVCAAPVSKS
jgi:hypothetical protein